MGRKEGDVVDRANEEIGNAQYLRVDGGRSYEDGVQEEEKDEGGHGSTYNGRRVCKRRWRRECL